ncbi:MAG TPA: IclR family transcriptional regulator [Ilumatobacter sp.]|nr:IclR family transcriptional regulator [Ilumatobacter sp.]
MATRCQRRNGIFPLIGKSSPRDTGNLPGPGESAVARTARVLDALRAWTGPGPIRLTEVARLARLPITSTHRLLGELVTWDFVDRVGSGYQLGTRLFELGEAVPRKRHLRDAALPFMQDLYEVTHGTIHLAILDGCHALYLEKLSGHRSAKSPSRIGGRVPATCTGIGKAQLAVLDAREIDAVFSAGLARLTRYSITDPVHFRAELDQARQRGYAVDREEAALGLGCVAAAIRRGPAGPVAGALSVSMPIGQLDIDRLTPAVRSVTTSLSRTLG